MEKAIASNRPVYIYSLKHPETGAVHYVGLSHDPQKRFYHHTTGSQSTKSGAWARSLRRNGKMPVLEILETITQGSGVTEERRWIDYYKAQGHPLINKVRFTTYVSIVKFPLALRHKVLELLNERGLTLQELLEKLLYEEIGRAEVAKLKRLQHANQRAQLRLVP